MTTGNSEQGALEQKKPLVPAELIILGDSGCGKSTLAGRLAAKVGRADETEQSIDDAEGDLASSTGLKFSTSTFCFTALEAPSNPVKLKNLAASSFLGRADFALLTVSAAPGELERGLSDEGRTREHALMAKALGTQQVVVCVTKMDAAGAGYAETRYEEVRSLVKGVLHAVGIMEKTTVVPVSSTHGDNIAEISEQMPWYKGPTLLQALDDLPPPSRPLTAPLRVSVHEAYHSSSVGAVAVGCVEQGTLRLGAQVCFAPGGAAGRVKSINVDVDTVREAYTRDSVSFVVDGVGVEDLRRGMVASEAERPAVQAETFLAHIAVLRGFGEVRAGFSPVLVCHAAQAPCRIEELVARLDRRNGEVLEEKPDVLRVGDVGLVRFRPEVPLCVEAHDECPQLGQFATAPEQTALALVGVVREVQPKGDKQ